MAVRQDSKDVPRVKVREIEQEIRLLAQTTKEALLNGGALPWRSNWLDISSSPTGSVHVHGSLGSLSAQIIVSNIAKDGAGMVIDTITAEKVVPWGVAATHPGGRYLQVNVTALADLATIGITAQLQSQSGA